MTRTLSKEEILKVKAFAKSVGPTITPWQPTYSQNERDAMVPSLIKDLLMELIALSSNDHLVDYAKSLKNHENQEEILSWLQAIKALNVKMTKDTLLNQNYLYSLYRNIYRVALYLARDTNLTFAANALNALSQIWQSLSKESLLEKVEPLKNLFNSAQANKPAKRDLYEPEYPVYISTEDIIKHLEPKRRPALLYRAYSDSAIIAQLRAEQGKKYDEMSPLKPRRLLTPFRRDI
jgi:hypothetical protein